MYTIYYDYRDPSYNKQQSGIYITDSLADVEAFYAMVKRYNGHCTCTIGTIGESE